MTITGTSRRRFLAAGTTLTAALMMSVPAAANDDVVNVYSARKEALILPLLERFEKENGIRVQLVTGKADALLKRLETEGNLTPADVFITVDAGRLQRAKDAGVLQPIRNDAVEAAVPANLRDPDHMWFGVSQRARPIMYVKGKVKPTELSTYEGLTDARWKGRVCIRSSGNIYNQSLVASMIEAKGAEATQKWAEGLVKNFARPPGGGDTDQLRAAAAGQCDIAVANTYYLGRLLASKKAEDRAVGEKLAVFWPNQADGERGTHVNVSGVGVTRHAKNREAAVKLLEFLVTRDAQAWYAEINHEYPVVPGTPISETVKAFGPFRADTLNLSKLGENNAEAVKLMDRAGWR